MKIYSQRNPLWSAQKLGKTKYEVGRYGCTITDIAMASDYFASIGIGLSQNPSYFAKALAFTDEGFLLWGSLEKCSRMVLEDRFKVRDDMKVVGGLKAKNKVALIQVNGNHWVLATGLIDPKNPKAGFKIADPFFGDRSDTKSRYGNKMTGGAIVRAI